MGENMWVEFSADITRVFRKPSDYIYVMQVINNKKVKDAPFFLTPDVFRLYLTKVERMFNATYTGLCVKLVALKQELLKEKATR